MLLGDEHSRGWPDKLKNSALSPTTDIGCLRARIGPVGGQRPVRSTCLGAGHPESVRHRHPPWRHYKRRPDQGLFQLRCELITVILASLVVAFLGRFTGDEFVSRLK